MWDLTPDVELLKELPQEYAFETALADLIVRIFVKFGGRFVSCFIISLVSSIS